MTVTALDQYGDTYSAYTGPECVTFSGPADGPDASPPTYPAEGACAAGSSVTFADGVATVDATLVDPQTTTVEVTDNASGASGTSAPIAVIASALPFDHHYYRRRDDLYGDDDRLDDVEYYYLYRDHDFHWDNINGDDDLHRDHINGDDDLYRNFGCNLPDLCNQISLARARHRRIR